MKAIQTKCIYIIETIYPHEGLEKEISPKL
jgi:hypothetical protein